MELSERDYELLSAYIDGDLDEAERATLESRLVTERDLRRELTALRQTVQLVKTLPTRKAPRDFVLTPAMLERSSSRPFADQPIPQPDLQVLTKPLKPATPSRFVRFALPLMSAAAAILLVFIGLTTVLQPRLANAPAPAAAVTRAVAQAPTMNFTATSTVSEGFTLQFSAPSEASDEAQTTQTQDASEEMLGALSAASAMMVTEEALTESETGGAALSDNMVMLTATSSVTYTDAASGAANAGGEDAMMPPVGATGGLELPMTIMQVTMAQGTTLFSVTQQPLTYASTPIATDTDVLSDAIVVAPTQTVAPFMGAMPIVTLTLTPTSTTRNSLPTDDEGGGGEGNDGVGSAAREVITVSPDQATILSDLTATPSMTVTPLTKSTEPQDAPQENPSNNSVGWGLLIAGLMLAALSIYLTFRRTR